MTRKISLPSFVLLLVAALTLTGCGRSTEAEFVESDDMTAEELAEEEEYNESYDAMDDATANPTGGDPFDPGN